jgi:hypothetical protein
MPADNIPTTAADVLRTRIEDVDWPADYKRRIINAVRMTSLDGFAVGHGEIQTLGDLIRHTPHELLRLPSYGRKCHEAVIETLRGFGLALAVEPEPSSLLQRTPRCCLCKTSHSLPGNRLVRIPAFGTTWLHRECFAKLPDEAETIDAAANNDVPARKLIGP